MVFVKTALILKKMRKYRKYILAFVMPALLLISGCNDFEEINTNPDTITQASASMVCTGIILSNLEYSGDGHAYLTPNALSKYIGYANESQMDEQYNKIGHGYFGSMTLLPNIDKLTEYAAGSIMESSYLGIAKFSRAYMFFQRTMEMGDIPYSEANQGSEENYRPGYDEQEDIFIGILDDLKQADAYFADGITFSGDPTPYNGDPDKWRRATNAFALKVLMTLSKKADLASLNVKSRFAEIVASGYLLESTTGFLGLNYSSTNRHPLSGTNDLFTSRTIPGTLLVNNLKKLNDRRLFYYADPAVAEINAGKTEDDTAAYVGVDVSLAYETMNQGHSASQYSLLNARYLNEEACEPRMVLTYAEQQLILAEARILGWITTGTAQEYYESGVRSALSAFINANASYAHGMAIDETYIDGYFTGEAAFKTDPEDQLKQIWMQRYLLNFMQDAKTSYFEYRRNAYPEFPINPATSLNENNTSGIPMRWMYPASESDYNSENLIEALNRQYEGYDEINKLMWLLK